WRKVLQQIAFPLVLFSFSFLPIVCLLVLYLLPPLFVPLVPVAVSFEHFPRPAPFFALIPQSGSFAFPIPPNLELHPELASIVLDKPPNLPDKTHLPPGALDLVFSLFHPALPIFAAISSEHLLTPAIWFSTLAMFRLLRLIAYQKQ